MQPRRTASREDTTLGLKVTSVDGPTQAAVAATRPLLVSAEEAAHLLGIGRTTLYRLAREGELRPVHIGRCVRFLVGELEGFVTAKHAHLSASREPD